MTLILERAEQLTPAAETRIVDTVQSAFKKPVVNSYLSVLPPNVSDSEKPKFALYSM